MQVETTPLLLAATRGNISTIVLITGPHL